MKIRVMKEGNKLGFGIRHDSQRKLRVSTLQGSSAAAKSPLRLGDILLSVNGINLNDLGFLEVIQHLKATKPGELVFDIERDMNTSPDYKYEFAPNDMLDGGGGDEFLGEAAAYAATNGGRLAGMNGVPGPPRQLSPHSAAVGSNRPSMEMSSSVRISAGEPQRKRARPSAGGVEGGNGNDAASKMEKTHKQVVNTLVLELKKEKAEKVHLEDKNNALRKRLQKMLIECDEVRVKASTEVAAVKDKARREIQELEKALVAARAQLRLNDRGPNVSRTDSLVKDLVACKAQLDRMKRIDAERSTQLTARYNLENRQAEREAHRVREKLIVDFQQQFRQVAKRGLTNGGGGGGGGGGGASGKTDNAQTVTVMYEGIRRLAFLKLFGLVHDYDHYTSSEYQSLMQIHRVLEHDEVADLFGNALSHEERTGFFIVAVAPMDVVYDPSTERLNLVCQWGEQNTIRELARNFRF
uniref:PDZ domain-containing protein n=1 Tax=Globisporangium ultimum (strain ATCC 200006 / CBS 805.95 / DAOM BR144) TaxID=431595 RepID=K3WTT0_GLOUD